MGPRLRRRREKPHRGAVRGHESETSRRANSHLHRLFALLRHYKLRDNEHFVGGPLAPQLFFEGGIDLTYVLSSVGVTQLPCFASFLEETRSSQSITAVLKDFVAAGFPVCGLSISKACGTSSVDPSGTFINYPTSGIVTNTGVGTLYNVTVFDTIGSSTTANQILVVNNTTGSAPNGSHNLAAGDTGTWSDSSTSTSGTQSDSAIAKGATGDVSLSHI